MRSSLADTSFTLDCGATSAAPPPTDGQQTAPPNPAGNHSPLLIDEPAAAELLSVSPRTLFGMRNFMKAGVLHLELQRIQSSQKAITRTFFL